MKNKKKIRYSPQHYVLIARCTLIFFNSMWQSSPMKMIADMLFLMLQSLMTFSTWYLSTFTLYRMIIIDNFDLFLNLMGHPLSYYVGQLRRLCELPTFQNHSCIRGGISRGIVVPISLLITIWICICIFTMIILVLLELVMKLKINVTLKRMSTLPIILSYNLSVQSNNYVVKMKNGRIEVCCKIYKYYEAKYNSTNRLEGKNVLINKK